jgi:hypothetical protein
MLAPLVNAQIDWHRRQESNPLILGFGGLTAPARSPIT